MCLLGSDVLGVKPINMPKINYKKVQDVISPEGHTIRMPVQPQTAKAIPNRTTKNSQKLTLFPEEASTYQEELVPEAEDLYDQLSQVPPERIGKLVRERLPSVSAFCTAASYRIKEILEYLIKKGCSARKFDECVHAVVESKDGQSIPLNLEDKKCSASFGEVFYFDYGVVVLWGFPEDEERQLLRELREFEEETLSNSDIETEKFFFHYNSNYQPRIYNDIISLKSPANYMIKLSISHAIAQSTKLTLFECLVEETITKTKHIPRVMAETGKVKLNRTAINKKIGQLFIMRINVNLVSNVLDTPEIFWSQPTHEPLYQAIRGYLEISQRVELLNQRVSVISDLLDMLREHLTSTHGEKLEWIVIFLIAFEILIGLTTIYLDFIK